MSLEGFQGGTRAPHLNLAPGVKERFEKFMRCRYKRRYGRFPD
jgi:hypothetical protein